MKRRSFIKKSVTGLFLAGGGAFPVLSAAADLERADFQKLTILHTNDVHSRLEPFPMDGGRHQGLGGVARRAALLDKIRAVEEEVLLLDCGDIFQGTPYFNFFEGALEIELMSKLQYDAATMGNHDFDAGIDGFLKQLPKADFPFVISNYDFSDTVLDQKTHPFQVFQKGDIKVGVLGVGIELKGLVPDSLYQNTRYLDPVFYANKYAAILKYDYHCDYVICLSHLGYEYKSDKVSDVVLAGRSKDIDLILGGHTHTFMEEPRQIKNADGRPILINQVGFAGIWLGRLDVYFSKKSRGFRNSSEVILIG